MDLDGGGNSWEERRAQPVEEEVGIRQECEAGVRENESRTGAKRGVVSYNLDGSVP
jgi:hypothetical protein